MTTDTPLTRYSATNGALASGFVTAELHHLMGHDRLPLEATAIVGLDFIRVVRRDSAAAKLRSPAIEVRAEHMVAYWLAK